MHCRSAQEPYESIDVLAAAAGKNCSRTNLNHRRLCDDSLTAPQYGYRRPARRALWPGFQSRPAPTIQGDIHFRVRRALTIWYSIKRMVGAMAGVYYRS
jgi:hypothetical protein